MLHIEIYIHTKKETGLLPEGFGEVIDKVAMSASCKLIEKGRISGDRVDVIELNLMSNEQIAKVNKRLRGKEGPTDVISLRLETLNHLNSKPSTTNGTSSTRNPDFPREVFGEIYVSLEKCALQAEEIGQSFLEELAFLTVHGILHIFDYDHQTSEEEAEMTKTAYEILGRE